jgi:branched-chain amino acid transport system substrate-binding protein
MRLKLRLEERRIRIGIGAPLTGESAPMGTEMKQAIEMAIEEANVAGGILGATITASVCDDNSDARGVASRVDTLCSQPDLLGVVGHYNSDVSIAASNIYSACDLAMITPIASNPELTDRMLPNVFRFTNRDDRTGSAIAEYLYTYLGPSRRVGCCRNETRPKIARKVAQPRIEQKKAGTDTIRQSQFTKSRMIRM